MLYVERILKPLISVTTGLEIQEHIIIVQVKKQLQCTFVTYVKDNDQN